MEGAAQRGGDEVGYLRVEGKGALERGALLFARGGEVRVREDVVGVREVVVALRVAHEVDVGGHGGEVVVSVVGGG